MPDTTTISQSATETLAQFASGIAYDALPQPVVSRLRGCFLDFVGISAFAAAQAETSPAFFSAVQTLGPRGPATVIGASRGYTYPHAALLNGALAHTMDFDDTNLFGSLHPGAPVIPAAMAVAQEVNASGRAFIEGLAAGYEVVCRVGAALGPTAYDRGFHITAVAGIFGAVAAAARLRNASAEVTANAFGIAASLAAGSMQYLENGSSNKRLHPGFAAHNALMALAFAEAGVLGARAPIEGRYGLLNGYSNAPNPQHLTAALGTRWTLVETAIKPYPSCRFTHAAIEAALMLRERVPARARAGASLQVRLSPKAVQIVGERVANKLRPQNIVDGQFSVYFQTAVAWADGRCDWDSYQKLGTRAIEKLTGRIEVVADPSVAFAGAEVSMQVSVENNGNRLSERLDEPLGEPQRPLSWEQLEHKFLTTAGPVFGVTGSRAMSRRIMRLEEEESVARLILRFRARSAH